MREDFSSFPKLFQENLVKLILLEKQFSDQMQEVLNVSFLEHKYLQIFTNKIFSYKNKYKKHPTVETMKTILRTELSSENELIQKQTKEYFSRAFIDLKVDNKEYIKEKSLEFCKKQVMKKAMLKSIDLLDKCSFEEIGKIIVDAMHLGILQDGYDYKEDFEERYKLKVRKPLTTGWNVIDKITKGGLGEGEMGVVMAGTGCHAKGTNLLMYDGSYKRVEDVVVGDKLMGPDSLPRNVLSLCRGKDKMYEIIPLRRSNSFVVNGKHILSLIKTTSEEIINISVEDFLKKSKNFKHLYKLYKSGPIDFNRNDEKLEIPPYILGCMIGDGSLIHNLGFSSKDEECIKEISSYVKNLGLKVNKYRKKNTKCNTYTFTKKGKDVYNSYVKNKFIEQFRELNLYNKRSGDKFIPLKYKLSSIQNRLEILAGLLDTDGYCDKCGFEFVTKSKQLSDDVNFICRSLGLGVHSTIKYNKKYDRNYYKTYISGDCSIIPTRLERKRPGIRKQIKRNGVTGFSIKPLKEDDYYGFMLDKDHLYLLDDFTVTHNSGKSMALVHLACQGMLRGRNVFYYTLELSSNVISLRMDSCITGISINDLNQCKDGIKSVIDALPGNAIIQEYPTKSATTQTIKNHLEKYSQKGIEPGLILVDYADLLRPIREGREKRHDLEAIYEEIRAIGQEYKCPIYTCTQINRSGFKQDVIDMDSISEAFNKCFPADLIFSLSRTREDKEANTGRIFVAKNRFGHDGIVYPIFMDTSNVKINIFERDEVEGKEILDKMESNKKDEKSLVKEQYKKFLREKREQINGNK